MRQLKLFRKKGIKMKYCQVKARTLVFVFMWLAVILSPGPCALAYTQTTTENKFNTEDWSGLKLWYRQPAQQWTEALPIGNGRLGAMIFGRTEVERIQLNEETVWTGGPYDPSNPDGPKALPEICRLIFEGKYREAQELFGRTMMGRPHDQMKYQPLGDLWLKFPGHGELADYRR